MKSFTLTKGFCGKILGVILLMMLLLASVFIVRIHFAMQEITTDSSTIFDNQSASSFDGKFEWVSQVEKSAYNDMNFVNISIRDVENNSEVILSEFQYRTFDFKWIAWEPDTYNLWVYSADIGIYCYVYDGDWTRYSLGLKDDTYYLSEDYSMGQSGDEPQVQKIDEDTYWIIRGKGDWKTYTFLNEDLGLISKPFDDISAWNMDKVVYAAYDDDTMKIVVQDIYDVDNYYREILRDYAPLAVPHHIIKEAEFIGESQLRLKYLKGENGEAVEEIIDL